MQEKILENLKSFEALTGTLRSLETDEERELFREEIANAASRYAETNEAAVEVARLLEVPEEVGPEVEISDRKLLRDCSEAALTLCGGEWTETTRLLASAMFLENGGTADLRPNAPVTFGELYGLSEEDELFSVEAPLSSDRRKNLPDSVFCGPNRSFPVNDRAHAIAALRMIGRYKGPGDKSEILACIRRKAKKFGVGIKGESESLVLFPLVVEKGDGLGTYHAPIEASSADELRTVRESLAEIAEAYRLDEKASTQLENILEELEGIAEAAFSEAWDPTPLYNIDAKESETAPVSVGQDFLFDCFLETLNENPVREAGFRQCVGLLRQRKIRRSEAEEAAKPYDVLPLRVMEKLFTADLDILERTAEEKGPETEPISTLDDPLPVVESESRAMENKTGKKKSRPLFKLEV